MLVLGTERTRSPLLAPLVEHGLSVVLAPEGAAALHTAGDLVDVVLVHLDGRAALAVLTQLRQRSDVPVLIVLRESRTPVEPYLDAGADDCVVAGLPREQVIARVRLVLRRRALPLRTEVLQVGALVLDRARNVCVRDGVAVHLPPKELGLLALLMRRDGRVVSREEALTEVWGPRRGGDPSTVDVHVKRLRAKVEDDPGRPTRLLTVRGCGYRLQA